jgi:hypothetical protein
LKNGPRTARKSRELSRRRPTLRNQSADLGGCGWRYWRPLPVHPRFSLLARKRLLINTPTSKIRSASVGLVEVSGVATGPYTIPAPITGNPCYLYQTIVWRQREESKSQEWKTVAEETLHVPFFLEDGTGKLLVSPGGAELDLHRDFAKYDQTWISQCRTRYDFLARHGIPGGDHFQIEVDHPAAWSLYIGTLANPGRVRPLAAAVDERPNSVRARNGAPQIFARSCPAFGIRHAALRRHESAIKNCRRLN